MNKKNLFSKEESIKIDREFFLSKTELFLFCLLSFFIISLSRKIICFVSFVSFGSPPGVFFELPRKI